MDRLCVKNVIARLLLSNAVKILLDSSPKLGILLLMAKPVYPNDRFPEPEIPAYLRPEYMGVAARFHAALLNACSNWTTSLVTVKAFDHADSFFAELDRRTKK